MMILIFKVKFEIFSASRSEPAGKPGYILLPLWQFCNGNKSAAIADVFIPLGNKSPTFTWDICICTDFGRYFFSNCQLSVSDSCFLQWLKKKEKVRFIFIYYDKPETLPLKAYLVKKSFHYFMTFYNSNVDFKTLLSSSTLTAFWRMGRWWMIICKHCRSLCFICIFNFNFICLCYYSYKMFCFYLKLKKKQGLCSDD